MSRVTRREWYERVNAEWPAQVPELTAEEAIRAFRRLYRFAFKHLPGPVTIMRGNRRMGRYPNWHINPSKGWHYLVHILSHYAERSGHNGKHARMELRMIREVKRRGWLDGRLKRPEQPPVMRDLRRERYERVLTRLASWEAKKKRAERAISKLRRQRTYYERR
jgi:hypothetical protein